MTTRRRRSALRQLTAGQVIRLNISTTSGRYLHWRRPFLPELAHSGSIVRTRLLALTIPIALVLTACGSTPSQQEPNVTPDVGAVLQQASQSLTFPLSFSLSIAPGSEGTNALTGAGTIYHGLPAVDWTMTETFAGSSATIAMDSSAAGLVMTGSKDASFLVRQSPIDILSGFGSPSLASAATLRDTGSAYVINWPASWTAWAYDGVALKGAVEPIVEMTVAKDGNSPLTMRYLSADQRAVLVQLVMNELLPDGSQSTERPSPPPISTPPTTSGPDDLAECTGSIFSTQLWPPVRLRLDHCAVVKLSALLYGGASLAVVIGYLSAFASATFAACSGPQVAFCLLMAAIAALIWGSAALIQELDKECGYRGVNIDTAFIVIWPSKVC